jgi:hypothetical protein
MHTQGWGLPHGAALCGGGRADPPFVRIGNGSRGASDSPAPAGKPESGRSELLATIKRRIKSGFYNSESVIDDLGHCFAQAVDASL